MFRPFFLHSDTTEEDGVTVGEVLTRKCQRWEVGHGVWVGEAILFLFPPSPAQIFLLAAFVLLWARAAVVQVCTKKQQEEAELVLIPEERGAEGSIACRELALLSAHSTEGYSRVASPVVPVWCPAHTSATSLCPKPPAFCWVADTGAEYQPPTRRVTR